MYTATWPKAIERMSEKYLRSPGIVTIGSVGQATDRIDQRVEYITGEAKRVKRLVEILPNFKAPVIVFVNLVKSADQLAKELNNAGWKAVTMHGHKTQDQRESSLAQLRKGSAHVLVATDVAGRGIDIPDVSLVVNFQMSKSIDAYTHRIGRTGRAGRSGVAVTFIGPEDEDVFYDLRQMLINSPHSSRMPSELRAATRRPLAPP
jgi:ATP-dependent RNA helicase DDX23/PRP28